MPKTVVLHVFIIYFYNLFFMVLDLRLTKRLGCRKAALLAFKHIRLEYETQYQPTKTEHTLSAS